MDRYFTDALTALAIGTFTGFAFVLSAHAIDQHFKMTDCLQDHSKAFCAERLAN